MFPLSRTIKHPDKIEGNLRMSTRKINKSNLIIIHSSQYILFLLINIKHDYEFL